MTTDRALTVQPERMVDIVRPAVTPEEALIAWAEYQAMKKALATPDDIQQIQGREFLKKSYWRKVNRFYKIDLECVRDEHEDTPDGQRIFYATYRATHSSGAHCDGDGLDYAADIDEYHNARATAHTRAKNRAISDLVGGGEVSAEEMGSSLRHGSNPWPEQLGEYWCKQHNTAWFKRGKMTRYAHPIGDKGPDQQWCNKPAATTSAPSEPPAPPAQAEDPAAGKGSGESENQALRVNDYSVFWPKAKALGYLDVKAVAAKLGMMPDRWLAAQPGRTLADAAKALEAKP